MRHSRAKISAAALTRNFEAIKHIWITDVTEFRTPAGKTYLSPIIDRFDGMPISRTISTTPDAEMANSSLLGACSQLKEGKRPKGHRATAGVITAGPDRLRSTKRTA